MAKRKKNSSVGKRRRKAMLARAAKKRRRKLNVAEAAASVPMENEILVSQSEIVESAEENAAAPTSVSNNGERILPKRKLSPLGVIKHEYAKSFVSKRESPRTDGDARPTDLPPIEDADGALGRGGEDRFLYAEDYDRESGVRGIYDSSLAMPILDPAVTDGLIADLGVGTGVKSAIERQIELDRQITEGNDALRFTRLSRSRDVHADVGSLPDFTSVIDKSDINNEAGRVKKNDINATRLRFEYRSALLKKELDSSARLLVNRAYGTDGEGAGRIRRRVRRLGRHARYAVKYEKADNARYYGALIDAYDRLASGDAHDKANLNALITELYELIVRRDAVNRRLIALYSGGSKRGVGDGKRESARLAAVRREQRRYERLYNSVLAAKIELRARDKLLSAIDKQIALAGEIAECKYVLSRTKVSRIERRSVRRMLRAKTEDYKIGRAEIEHKSGVLIRKAWDRRRANAFAVVGWVAFGILLLVGGLVWWNWDVIFKFLSERASDVALELGGRI